MKLYRLLLAAGLCGCFGTLSAAELSTPIARYVIDDATGAVREIVDLADDSKPVTAVANSYLLQKKSGDAEARESGDRATRVKAPRGELRYCCVNPQLPGIQIHKRYWICNNGLRRELTFINKGTEKCYVLPFTESDFEKSYKDHGYYFGAGYVGPFKPAAKVSQPFKVEQYVQTSKGMVIVNTDRKKGGYANYRVKINDTVVYPWWQSTIGRYREKADRLYYMPNGWKMCLGALDVEPNGGEIRYTDEVVLFRGGLYEFFNAVYLADPEVKAALAAIEPVPEKMEDMLVHISMASEDSVRHVMAMLDEGWAEYNTSIDGKWFDYVPSEPHQGRQGGIMTMQESADFFQNVRNTAPGRVDTTNYTVAISIQPTVPLFKQHPEWFRPYDRNGDADSLFPGHTENYQTMLNRPEARQYFIDGVIAMAKALGNHSIYVDEAQQYNVINWQTGETMRDDHVDALWKELRRRATQEGMIFTMNGSGQPYGDFSYMENARLLEFANWREYAGTVLGMELFSMARPNSRICPLYWHILSENDYSNRCIALGWIPALQYAAERYPLAPVRATYEMGNTEPANVTFTPDWTRDEATDVEGYAVRRDHAGDVVVSFMNRAKGSKNVPVTIDFATTGFAKDQAVNVWRVAVERYAQETPLPYYYLANKEYRKIYAETGWIGGFVGTPELVYSGKAEGIFQDTAPAVRENHMVQYLITASPMAIFAENDLPQNFYFTRTRKGEVKGDAFTSTAAATDLLLADKDHEFTAITVDGAPAAAKTVDVGGLAMQLVTVPAGAHKLAYTRVPRKPAADSGTINAKATKHTIEIADSRPDDVYVVTLRGRTVYTGPAPIRMPDQREGGVHVVRKLGCTGGTTVNVRQGAWTTVPQVYDTKFHPMTLERKPADVTRDGVKITESATYISGWEDAYQMQPGMPAAIVAADPEKGTLFTATSERERISYVKHYTSNFAGMELSGARQVRFRLRNNFSEGHGIEGGHVTYNWKHPWEDFAGFVIDFRVNGKYAKRVALSIAIFNEKMKNTLPPWGCGVRPVDDHFDLGPIGDTKPDCTMSFDLSQIAPEGWDGTCYFSVGETNLNPNRKMALEFLSFNDAAATDFVRFSKTKYGAPDPLNLPKLTAKPRSLTQLDQKEWAPWAKITGLQKIAQYPHKVTQQTFAWLAYDEQNLYVAAYANETARSVKIDDAELWRNDCLEFYFIRPDKQIMQMVIDASGKFSIAEWTKGRIPTDGIVVKSQLEPGKGFAVFAAIPFAKIGWNSALGNQIRFNLCRSRNGENQECGTWGNCEQRYAEPDAFGTLNLGQFSSGMGRWLDYTLDNR